MIGQTLLKRYKIESQLGQGGMGTVYRAHDTLLNRPVAVKVLSAQGLGTEGKARMLAEARAAAKLNHPNIVTVFDAGEVNSIPFVVMELISGQTLRDIPPPEVNEVIRIAREICDALEHAHTNGIIHRDLKLENIFLTQTGTIKLVDFGLARSSDAPHITQEGALVGTFAYIAPELIQGQPASAQSDLYALGVMLYQLTTGRAPFTGDNVVNVISQHLHVTPVPPSTYNATIPPRLELLILRLLAKQPSERPASAAEVREMLRKIIEAESTPGTPLPAPLEQIVRGSFVGREHEFSEANAQWQKAVSGQGSVLLISGEPGIGKTRLARELISLAGFSKGLALVGECYAEGGMPYAPVARMLQEAVGSDSLHRSLGLPENVMADLITIAPGLRSYYPDISPNPPLDPQAEQQRLFDHVVDFVSALSAKVPILWLVDDAHWADAGSLVLVRHLARRTRNARILIVLTYREVELSEARALNEVLADLNRERLAERIKLTRFSREQTRELLGVMFAEDITPEFLEAIFREAEGNPFFVEEVCKALIEEGKLYRENGHWQRPAMDQIHVPQGVRVAIESRLERLPVPAQDALRIAAVIGREFDFETLLGATEQGEDSLIDSLEAAQHAQLITEVNRSGRVTFSFVHALIPSALRDNVSALRLQRMYRKTATALETTHPQDYEILAYHFAQGGVEEPTRKYYRLAADQAMLRSALPDAERNYRIALDLATEPHERARLMEDLAFTLFSMGSLETAGSLYREAIPLFISVDDFDAVGRVYASLSSSIWQGGDTPGALACSLEGEQVLSGKGDSHGKAALLHEIARQYYFNGRLKESRPHAQQALAMAEQFGDRGLQVQCLVTRALSEPLDEQLVTLPLALKIGREDLKGKQPADLGLLIGVSRTLNNYAEALSGAGRIREALAILREMADHARGSGLGEAWAWVQIAYRQIELGEFSAAETSLNHAKPLFQSDKWGELHVQWRACVLSLRFFRGDRGALGEFVELFERCQAEGNLQDVLGAGEALLDIFITEGDGAGALPYVEQLRPLVVEDGVANWMNHIEYADFCAVYALQGRLEEARGELQKVQGQANARSSLLYPASLARAEAHLACAESRWEDANVAFERFVRSQEQMERRWHQANALYEWARAIAPYDRARANDLLDDATAIFEKLDVPGYARQLGDFRVLLASAP